MIATSITAIVPAAGIGTRMQSQIPKQYLSINGKTILEITLETLLQVNTITNIVVALHADDSRFTQLPIASHPRISTTLGGESRAESVVNALEHCHPNHWVLVHDAARPCVLPKDIHTLITQCSQLTQGGAILAAPVVDTMKRSARNNGTLESCTVTHTVDREGLWHALTPQMFIAGELKQAYIDALDSNAALTDEASAMENQGYPVQLVSSFRGNIKVTHPTDLALAAFYLQQESAL